MLSNPLLRASHRIQRPLLWKPSGKNQAEIRATRLANSPTACGSSASNIGCDKPNQYYSLVSIYPGTQERIQRTLECDSELSRACINVGSGHCCCCLIFGLSHWLWAPPPVFIKGEFLVVKIHCGNPIKRQKLKKENRAKRRKIRGRKGSCPNINSCLARIRDSCRTGSLTHFSNKLIHQGCAQHCPYRTFLRVAYSTR